MTQVLAIVGPTGVGKSEVAQLLAERLGGEVISADSMQVYRGLDIGTGKVPPCERRVVHHCLDVLDIDQPYSAADYQREARRVIDDCLERGVRPIVCGGTGLYVRAALDSMEFAPGEQSGNAVRERLERELADKGAAWMWRRLLDLDPACEPLIHPNNSVRVVRAIEMAERGTLYSEQHAGFRVHSDLYDAAYVGLTMDRALLYQTIESRIDSMVAAGWLDEVARLVEAGYGGYVTDKAPIGYPELVEVVRGERTLTDALTAIKTGTRRYAKRQLTWFRSDPRVRWLDRSGISAEDAAEGVLALAQLEQTDPREPGSAD